MLVAVCDCAPGTDPIDSRPDCPPVLLIVTSGSISDSRTEASVTCEDAATPAVACFEMEAVDCPVASVLAGSSDDSESSMLETITPTAERSRALLDAGIVTVAVVGNVVPDAGNDSVLTLPPAMFTDRLEAAVSIGMYDKDAVAVADVSPTAVVVAAAESEGEAEHSLPSDERFGFGLDSSSS